MAAGRSAAPGMADAGPQPDPAVRALYKWLDTVPLSRPRRNIARDFSDGVLVAEVVKFFFPTMVDLHSFVPASSTAQKLANWGHLNRKVLSKLNFRVSEELLRQLVQSRPGAAEQVLLQLRDKVEKRQRHSKGEAGQPPGAREVLEEGGYLDTGPSKVGSDMGGDSSREGPARGVPGDAATRLQLVEREQALHMARDTIQILQAKVERLEQLLLLKNLRIDDLSRRLQRGQGQGQGQGRGQGQGQGHGPRR